MRDASNLTEYCRPGSSGNAGVNRTVPSTIRYEPIIGGPSLSVATRSTVDHCSGLIAARSSAWIVRLSRPVTSIAPAFNEIAGGDEGELERQATAPRAIR